MNDGDPRASNGAFVKLKPLVSADASRVEASFDELARGLDGAVFSGTIRVTLIDGPQAQRVTISIQDGHAQPAAEGDAVDVELLTSPKTWLAIAEGKRAPLDAFTGGEMRVRGDYKLARRAMIHLAAGPGRTGIC